MPRRHANVAQHTADAHFLDRFVVLANDRDLRLVVGSPWYSLRGCGAAADSAAGVAPSGSGGGAALAGTGGGVVGVCACTPPATRRGGSEHAHEAK